MRITRLEIVHVRPRFSFLRVHTDAGLVGLGEACLEGRARVVEAAVMDFQDLLVGQDPRRVERLWHLMFRSSFYPAVADGYTMVKTALPGPARVLESKAYIDSVVARMTRVREAIGDDVDFAIDFHGRVNPALALQLIPEVEHLKPVFVEEPCLPENVDAMAAITSASPLPIATG